MALQSCERTRQTVRHSVEIAGRQQLARMAVMQTILSASLRRRRRDASV
jgi:hypothetical protein